MKAIKIFLSMLLITGIALSGFSTEALAPEEITAPSALLMEAKTGKILYEKNSGDSRACASITKVMTLLLVMEALDSGKLNLNDTITASEHAASMGGSDIWLKAGETMSANDMIKATAVASANDAAVALAEHLCTTEEAFVEKMNQRAAELGMKDTVFKNCNGLDEDGHVTTALDVALMSRELIKHPKIFDYTTIWMDFLRDGKTQIVNTNKLLKSYNGANGLKTGTTSQAGSCITATATRDDLQLIAVVLGSVTGKDRFSDATKILNYGFSNYKVYTPEVNEFEFDAISVTNGMQDKVEVEAIPLKSIIIPKGDSTKLETVIELSESVEAPIEKEQVVGNISYKIGNEIVAQTNIVTKDSVEEINFHGIFEILLKAFISP